MAFELNSIVPWGRNLDEYTRMFRLSNIDLGKRIISFGDGPASFNAEMTKNGKTVFSIDPIYQFSKKQISKRINETKDIVITQTKNNLKNFIWESIKNVEELESMRISAMNKFLEDFEEGKKIGRYINHELPNKLDFEASTFDLGLSSHFLILYSQLGIEFHIKSITEMLRVCMEIRIFPLLDLNAQKSEIIDEIIKYFKIDYFVQVVSVEYEFQKGGYELLIIKKENRVTIK